jgi:long-chain acyl-CoA synthetase
MFGAHSRAQLETMHHIVRSLLHNTQPFIDSHVNLPGKERVGFVGLPQNGVEQRIADDGEIQIKSPGMMMGYYKNEEATNETFTSDFWLRTGDKGELDGMGRLKITGRTKEIFKTSKGKYVAPAPIESMFISHPLVEMACVGGRGEPAPHVIVLLGDESKKAAKMGGDKKDEIQWEMESQLKKVNDNLAEHEKLQFLVIVNEEWLPENGFVTPTNKIKRSKIEQEHLQYLYEWYESDSKVIWHKFGVRRSSLVNVMRNSVKSIETMSRGSLESMRSMSFKRPTANVSRKELNKLHAIDKMSEMRDTMRDWLK